MEIDIIAGARPNFMKIAPIIESIDKLDGVDFDTIFANTNTSYNPDEQGRSSGKSGADVERILAFHQLGRKDPVEYIDGWETAKKHVEKLLKNHA